MIMIGARGALSLCPATVPPLLLPGQETDCPLKKPAAEGQRPVFWNIKKICDPAPLPCKQERGPQSSASWASATHIPATGITFVHHCICRTLWGTQQALKNDVKIRLGLDTICATTDFMIFFGLIPT